MNRINSDKSNNKKKREKIEQELIEEKNIPNKKVRKEQVKKKKDKKKKSLIRRFFNRIFILLLLIVIILGILFYKKTEENGGGIKGALTTVLGLSVENIENLEPINILVLGISEDINATLTDTIILCSYNPKTNKASMISIPRDTFVGTNKESAKGKDKINSLYSKSPQKLLKAVSNITGVDVEYYAVVKTQALIEIVDIIGGVKFDVPINMNYDDPTQDLHIHLNKGMQKIDGEKAEQLLRFRHNNDGTSYPANYGDNDFGRMKTQRAFMTETIRQTLKFRNIFKSKTIIDSVFNNIETNIEIDELKQYIPFTTEFDMSTDIISHQLPGMSEKCNDLWFFVHDKEKTKELLENLEL